MIHFNDLYISDDNQSLIVDVEIDGFPVYEDTSINSIDLILGYCSDSPVTVNLWENKPIVVGDFDNDGKITSEDAVFLQYLHEAMTNDIYRTNDGTYFYIRHGELFETDEVPDIIKQKAEEQKIRDPRTVQYALALNNEFVKEVVRIYNKYDSFFDSSTEPRLNAAASNTDKLILINGEEWQELEWEELEQSCELVYEFSKDHTKGEGKLLSYIMDLYGDALNTSVYGDINGDGEVGVADINVFVDMVINASKDQSDPDHVDPIIYYETVKHKHICISNNDLRLPPDFKDFSSGLFVVQAEAKFNGNAEELAKMGCGWDESVITGVTYNGKPLYDAAIRYADNYGDTCDTDNARQFEDFILRYYAFLFALKCGDICQAQYYWDNYLTGKTTDKRSGTYKPCGCHGAPW